jgi:hypothetical protein
LRKLDIFGQSRGLVYYYGPPLCCCVRVSLKDQLILTTDEAHAAAVRAVEEKKLGVKKPGKRGRKRKAQEVESESEDSSSQLGSDPIVPADILNGPVVQ